MKLRLIILMSLVLGVARAQEVPLFVQRTSNTFLYNPAVAGDRLGAITLSHRQYLGNITDAPTSTMLGGHMPFSGYRFGTGVVYFQDVAGAMQTQSISAAFAFHMIMPNRRSVSMGVAPEFQNYRLVPRRVDVASDGANDPVLGANRYSAIDFSGGLAYQSPHVRAGVSVNRFRGWLEGNYQPLFRPFGTAYFQLIFQADNSPHAIEPAFSFRYYNAYTSLVEGGAYYSYKSKLTAGGAYRLALSPAGTGGNSFSITAAFQVYSNITIGYTYEMFATQPGSSIGPSHELTVRFDFWDRNDVSGHRRYGAVNTSRQSAHRKTKVNYFMPKVPLSHYKRDTKRARVISPATKRHVRTQQKRWKTKRKK